MSASAIPCVVYAARSTEDTRGSIPDQLRECRAAIELGPGREIVGEYTDEAFSAYTGNRGPGLVDAMNLVEDLARERRGAELWAQHSDRLARGDGKSARHAVEIALWALKRDVRVRTIQDPDTFHSLLYAVVTGQRNHEDSRRKSLAVAAGKRRAAARGDYVGYRPDGYKLAVELDSFGAVKKRLVIDPARQPAIAMIFRLALQKRSKTAIARALNRAGWSTKQFHRNHGPKPWTTRRVAVVLSNPRYAGLAVCNGELVAEGHWPAYITPRQYERLAERQAERRRTKKHHPPDAYLLSHLATCGHCGRPLRAATTQRRYGRQPDRRYMCVTHEWGVRMRCGNPRMPAPMVEAMFVASLGALLAAGDAEQLDEREMALRRRAVRSHELWAEEEQIGRSDATRQEALSLNRMIRSWFSRVTVTMDETGVTFETVTRSVRDVHGPTTAEVRVDLQEWTRRQPHARAMRGFDHYWKNAEILGALQAWADTHGCSPTKADWDPGDPAHPCAKVVLSRFKTWKRALERAGLSSLRAP